MTHNKNASYHFRKEATSDNSKQRDIFGTLLSNVFCFRRIRESQTFLPEPIGTDFMTFALESCSRSILESRFKNIKHLYINFVSG